MNPVIVISDGDNVATALEALEAGRVLDRPGAAITVREAIPRGHKIALAPIPAGGSVIKYGSSIGVATAEIAAGAHVHTHNVASARGRGDLASTPPLPVPRLAEPSDDRRDG
jgi:altronate dehydratase small subunit